MKYIQRVVFLLMFCLMLGSCEKVVDLKLKSIDAKYVIEGVVTNELGKCKVTITSTKDVNESNQFGGVSGAIVKIESKGVGYPLIETSAGIYQSKTLKGVMGQTYLLTVSLNGQTFTAASTMPIAEPFQNMYLGSGDFAATRTIVSVSYKDDADTKNYYWFQQYVNNIEQPRYAVVTDEYSVGQNIVASLIFENTTGDTSKDLKKGDKLTVEMHAVEEPMYTYLFSLYGATGSDNGTAPANPESNLKGGALGYFSAHTTQRRVLVIP